MYVIHENGKKKYVTSSDELFKILKEKNIVLPKILDIMKHPYFFL